MGKNSSMKTWQWLLSTALAGFTMAGGLVTYFETHVYAHSDGEKLEERVTELEKKEREDLKDMHDKVLAIYQMLSERRGGDAGNGE